MSRSKSKSSRSRRGPPTPFTIRGKGLQPSASRYSKAGTQMQTKLSNYKTRQRSALNLVVRTGPEADRVDDSVFEVTRSCVREGQPSDPNGLLFSQVKPSNRGKNSNPFGPIRHPHSLRRSPGTLSSLRYTEGPGRICLLTTSQPLGMSRGWGAGGCPCHESGAHEFHFWWGYNPKTYKP